MSSRVNKLLFLGSLLSPWRHPYRVLFLVFLVLCVLGWKLSIKKDLAENYITAEVIRSDIENLVTATGILQPKSFVDVGAQVSGQLKKIYVAVGSEVKAGDLLAEIDATVYSAKVDGIRAQLRNQKAQLLDKQAQLTLATLRFERQQALQRDNATTKENVQIAEATLRSAEAQLLSVEAQIQQIESNLRSEEATLSYARIYAPMTGTVVSINARQGQTLNTNQQTPTIMRLADLTSMTVQTQVSEADIGKLSLNMPVYFTTLGGKDYRWYSALNRIEPTPSVSNNVVLYNALFEVPNENRMLMTQMTTQVFFVLDSVKNSLVVPLSALNFDLTKKDKVVEKTEEKISKHRKKQHDSNSDSALKSTFVQVIGKDGKITERKIRKGISNRIQVQVLEGLQEGELVVTGIGQLKKTSTSTLGVSPAANASKMMR